MTDRGSSRREWTFFDLPVPQYANVPELVVSALAWSATDKGKAPSSVLGRPSKGIVYQLVDPSKGLAPDSEKKVRIETMPPDHGPRWDKLTANLTESLSLPDQETAEKVARIFLHDLLGNVPARAVSRSIVPFNAFTALMQDPPGMVGAENPPNFALMMQRMFVLGNGQGDAARLLADAYKWVNQNHKNDWITNATSTITPDEVYIAAASLLTDNDADAEPNFNTTLPAWLVHEQTPFSWFANAWGNLMQGKWKEKMPRRRWVDWASCILRTALGAGYVFELNFYYQLVLALTNDMAEGDAAEKALSRHTNFFTWDAFSSVSTRDVASRIRKICERGTACRAFIQNQAGEDDPCPKPFDYFDDPKGPEHWIRDARVWLGDDEAKQERVRQAIAGARNRTANNAQETINFALLDRGDKGGNEDLYSLIRKRGRRYSVVEPGQEWFVVVASMQASDASEATRVADVVVALDAIGVTTGYKTIVNELERVGLARTSHDADDAIEVAAAF